MKLEMCIYLLYLMEKYYFILKSDFSLSFTLPLYSFIFVVIFNCFDSTFDKIKICNSSKVRMIPAIGLRNKKNGVIA